MKIYFSHCTDYKKKPEIGYPMKFEHTIHVGFDPITGEFTVSIFLFTCQSTNVFGVAFLATNECNSCGTDGNDNYTHLVELPSLFSRTSI